MDDPPLPALGSLPLERYVLYRWNSSNPTDHDERRRQLVSEFVQLGSTGRAQHFANLEASLPSDYAPQAQWETILSPLRTAYQRRLASPHSFMPLGQTHGCFGIVWLRTSYDDNDDAYQELLDRLNSEMALDIEEMILDDEALYNYGNAWQQIFKVIPERLLLIDGDEGSHVKDALDHDAWEDSCKRAFAAGDFDEDLIKFASRREIPGEVRQRTDSEVEANIFRAKTSKVHFTATLNYLFVADKEAIETGKVMVVFFDQCGRTTRWTRIEPEYCEDLADAWAGGHLTDDAAFEEAEIGSDYMPGGICGPPYK